MSESLNHSFDQFVRFIQEQNSQYWNGSAVALFETIFKQKQIKYLATLCLKYKLLQINLICIKLNDVSSVTQSYCVLITLITSQKRLTSFLLTYYCFIYEFIYTSIYCVHQIHTINL